MFSLWMFVLIWVGKRLSTQLLLAVGVCSLGEWKCICVTPLKRVPGVAVHLRGEEHTCNPGVLGAGLAGVAARMQCSGLGATQQAQQPGWSPVCFRAGNPAVSHKCTLGVFIPGERPTGCLSQLTESDLPSLQRGNRSRKQRERQRSQAQTAGRQHRGDHQEGPEVNTAHGRGERPAVRGRSLSLLLKSYTVWGVY